MYLHKQITKPSLFLFLIGIPLASTAPKCHADIDLSNFTDSKLPSSIAGDGSVLTGTDIAGSAKAFIWSTSGGITYLGSLVSGGDSFANGISRNGSIVVGGATTATGNQQGFRWTSATGMVALPFLNTGDDGTANAISADGSRIVGWNYNHLTGYTTAVFWSGTNTVTDLGRLNNGTYSVANAVSADGNVIAGTATDGNDLDAIRAFRWTQSTGMVSLGTLHNGDSSTAIAVSYDGNVIVGSSEDGDLQNARRAFRWTSSTGMVSLGVLSGDVVSMSTAISGDGKVIVGNSVNSTTNGSRGFRWTTTAIGMQTIEQWLTDNGSNLSMGSLSVATTTATNEDGTVVVGKLSNGNGYIARATDGIIDTTDYSKTIGTTALLLPTLANYQADLVMHGAHGNPMQSLLNEGVQSFGIAGDLGRQDHNQADGNMGVGEASYARGLAHSATFKIALGTTYSADNTAWNGKTSLRGSYLIPELIIRLPNSALYSTFSAYFNEGNADVRRNYLNGGQVVSSTGSPDVRQAALRLRLDWQNALNLHNTFFTPYTSLTYSRSDVEAYTEHGGGFPIRWNKRKDDSTQLRLGLDATHRLNDRFNLLARIEAVHRMETTGSRAAGQIIGLNSFELPGIAYQQNWLRTSVGIDGEAGPGRASITLNASTEGSTPSAWLYGSYRWIF